MRTVETVATITPENKLIASVPKDIPQGECQVVLVIEQNLSREDQLESLRNDIASGIEQADRGELIEGSTVFQQLRVRNQQFQEP